MNYHLMSTVELYNIMMHNEIPTTQLAKMRGFSLYMTVTTPDFQHIARGISVLEEYNIEYDYIGRYFTRNYETLDVYGIVDCPEELAVIIRMTL